MLLLRRRRRRLLLPLLLVLLRRRMTTTTATTTTSTTTTATATATTTTTTAPTVLLPPHDLLHIFRYMADIGMFGKTREPSSHIVWSEAGRVLQSTGLLNCFQRGSSNPKLAPSL